MRPSEVRGPGHVCLPFCPSAKASRVFDFGGQLILGSQDFASMGEAYFRAIEQAVGCRQAVDRFVGKIAPLQRHDVDAARLGGDSFHKHVGGHVVQRPAQTGQKSYSCRSSRSGAPRNHRKSTRGRARGHAQPTVSHWRLRCDCPACSRARRGNSPSGKFLSAQAGDAIFLFAAPVDRDSLAQRVAIADLNASVAALIMIS